MRNRGFWFLGAVLFLLAAFLVLTLAFNSADREQSGNIAIPTLFAFSSQNESTSKASSCGVGVRDHDAAIWVEGSKAQKVCEAIIVGLKRGGDQPREWAGYVQSRNYYAVCADEFDDFAYEVVDTGMAIYGKAFCDWMVATYGASVAIIEPDLFGIIEAAQATVRVEDATFDADMTKQAEQARAEGARFWATAEAELCADLFDMATADAQAGQPWRRAPELNERTAKCEMGAP